MFLFSLPAEKKLSISYLVLAGEIVSSTLLGSSYTRHSLRFSAYLLLLQLCCPFANVRCNKTSIGQSVRQSARSAQSASVRVAVGLFSELYFSAAAF